MLHVSDTHISKGRMPERRNQHDVQAGGSPVRGFCRNCCGCWRIRLCSIATYQKCCPRSVDSGPAITPGNRAATSFGPWVWAATSVDAYSAARRCSDRGGRGAALQGACGSGGRNLGRSARIEFYRDETTGPAGRGHGGSLLACQARGNSRSQCGTGPLARCLTAIGTQPRRYEGSRRPALAGRVVPITRQTTWHMGGAV